MKSQQFCHTLKKQTDYYVTNKNKKEEVTCEAEVQSVWMECYVLLLHKGCFVNSVQRDQESHHELIDFHQTLEEPACARLVLPVKAKMDLLYEQSLTAWLKNSGLTAYPEHKFLIPNWI